MNPPSKSRKLMEGSDIEDLISRLPDTIIHYILSFLPTKDNVRTSVLSRRWKNMWTSVHNIDINERLFKSNQQWISCETAREKEVLETHFVNFVNRVLLLCDSRIENFSLEFRIIVSASILNSWISAAIQRRVKNLNLTSLDDTSVLPSCLFNSETLTELNLQIDCLFNVPDSIYFPSLKNLHLESITFIDDRSAQRFFSSLLVLEMLSIRDVRWNNIRNVSITIPTLTSLYFGYDTFNCSNDDLLDCKVRVYASNLRTLYVQSNVTFELVLHNVHSLVEACIDLDNDTDGPNVEEIGARAVKLVKAISCVKSLEITRYSLQALSCEENLASHLPIFYNLTHIDLTWPIWSWNIEPLMDIIQKSPNLESLKLVGPESYCEFGKDDLKLESTPHCFKSSLKILSVSHFQRSEEDMELLKFFLENAIPLERITLFCDHDLFRDLEKQEESIKNELLMYRRPGKQSCVIEFYEDLDW